MTSRMLLCVLAAPLALSGCGLFPTSSDPGKPTIQACSTNPCDVTVKQPYMWPFSGLDVPDKIDIDSKVTKTMTWTIDGYSYTHFNQNPKQGIVFKKVEAQRYFECGPAQGQPADAPRVYTCTSTAPPGEYEYGIRTKGFGSPPDKDPWVVSH